ncbi:MAG TPA: hypothetical protein VN436_09200, partial [Holophaga sp.]|nr:hypothetical protein [Holophaga sp.]
PYYTEGDLGALGGGAKSWAYDEILPPPYDRTFRIDAEARQVVVLHECRTVGLEPETRTSIVAHEFRALVVEPENRVVIVPEYEEAV